MVGLNFRNPKIKKITFLLVAFEDKKKYPVRLRIYKTYI